MNVFERIQQAVKKIVRNPAAELAGALRTLDTLETGAQQLGAVLAALPDGREKSLAQTKLDEAILWGQKAIAVGQAAQLLIGGAADAAGPAPAAGTGQ